MEIPGDIQYRLFGLGFMAGFSHEPIHNSVVVYYFHKALLIQGRVYRIRKEV